MVIFKKNNTSFVLKNTYHKNTSVRVLFENKNKNCILLPLKSGNFNKNFLQNKSLGKKFNNKNIFYINLYFYKSKKVRFKSKGFRVKYYKKKKLIKFLFGYSHFNWLFISGLNIKRKGKYKFFMRHYSEKILHKFCKFFIKLRKFNPYTGRGCRTNRQVIFRKKGKKS